MFIDRRVPGVTSQLDGKHALLFLLYGVAGSFVSEKKAQHNGGFGKLA